MPSIAVRDPNHAKCVVCKLYKEHVDSGIITVSGKILFIADKGTAWQGKTCPACVDIALTGSGKPGQAILPQLLNYSKQPRVCRDCNRRVLPVRRARVCEFCQPTLNTDVNDDFIYHDMDGEEGDE
jgi:hypothetical protein